MKLNELVKGMKFETEALVLSSQRKVAKNGSSYFDVVFSDSTCSIQGKVWGVRDTDELLEGSVYSISGSVSEYRNALQLDISGYFISNADPSDYCVHSKFSDEQLLSSFENLRSAVKNEYCVALLNNVFTEDVLKEFSKHSAAKSVHHAFVGGLIQHSICVATAALKLCELYTMADRDLVITAALLHDIGKVYELSNFPAVDYTRAGDCMGHISLGAMIIQKGIDSIPEFPAVLHDKLMNCILSHHGRLEYGSPVLPCTIEAIIVSNADLIDSKIEQMVEASVGVEPGSMSAYVNALGTRVLV